MQEKESVTQDSNGRLLDSASGPDNHPDPWILHVIHTGKSHPDWGPYHKPTLSFPTATTRISGSLPVGRQIFRNLFRRKTLPSPSSGWVAFTLVL
jgi:hypothetical protein